MKKNEVLDVISNLAVLKDKLEDLQISHGYFADDYFTDRELKTRDDLINHGISYKEQRIATDQMNELMRLYVAEFENIIKQLEKHIKKALY